MRQRYGQRCAYILDLFGSTNLWYLRSIALATVQGNHSLSFKLCTILDQSSNRGGVRRSLPSSLGSIPFMGKLRKGSDMVRRNLPINRTYTRASLQQEHGLCSWTPSLKVPMTSSGQQPMVSPLKYGSTSTWVMISGSGKRQKQIGYSVSSQGNIR